MSDRFSNFHTSALLRPLWETKGVKCGGKQEVLTCIWVSDVFLSPTQTQKPLSLTLGGLEAGRPHIPNTQMEAKCFIWWPLTNHTERPRAANTAAAYCRQALIWGDLIAFKVFTLIKLNSCDTPLRTFKVGWSKYPNRDCSERHRKGCMWHWGVLLHIPHKAYSLL